MYPAEHIQFAGSVLCGLLAYFIILRHPRSKTHLILAAAVALVGLESLFNGLSIQSVLPANVVYWQQLRWITASMIPFSWFAFGLVLGREDPEAQLKKNRWVLLGSILVFPFLASPLSGPFFTGQTSPLVPEGWLLPLGKSGFIFGTLFILGIVVFITLLERLLRASRGIKRWELKYLVLGVAAYFGVRIFTMSQALLFKSLNLNLEMINGAALIITTLLITVTFFRTRVLPTDIYLSPQMIQHSITITLVGLYFIIIGVIAIFIRSGSGRIPFQLLAFLIFLTFIGLTAILLSDRVRQSMKLFVSRHFQRPLYDYRSIWERFTRRISPILEIKTLCGEASKFISEILEVLSVSIWLVEDPDKGWNLYGSTAHSDLSNLDKGLFTATFEQIAKDPSSQDGIIDLQNGNDLEDAPFRSGEISVLLKDLRMRYLVALNAPDGALVGMMVIGNKVREIPLTTEEREIARTVAGQLAARVQNIKLIERLQHAKEVEALQAFSAFFIHDLKNLSSKLSLMLHNLPAHFENPEFREDSLRLISQSVEQINSLNSRISALRDNPDLNFMETDLDEVINSALDELNGLLRTPIKKDLSAQTDVTLDPEQIRKVLTNLVLNADEASDGRGDIVVSSGRRGKWITFSVTDSGCGISEEFLKSSLFRPLHTTKTHGMGIGLFHCKTIVEAHKGRIEVESRLGHGTTFEVFLPEKLSESQ